MLATEQAPTTRSVADLHPSAFNPRGPVDPTDPTLAELAQSIREHGILQSLVCQPDGTVLIGHRRLAAARLAGLDRVPVVVREVASEAEAIAMQLVENLQRQDLSPLQEARAIRRLIDSGIRQADVCRRLGLTGQYVRRRLTLLNLDGDVQALVERREIPIGLVDLLATVGDHATQRRLANLAATRRMTLSELEETIRRGHTNGATSRPTLRAKVSPAGKPGRVVKIGRREAVQLLKRSPERRLTFADLMRVFDGACSVCEDCGLQDLDPACRECPGPDMVRRLAGG